MIRLNVQQLPSEDSLCRGAKAGQALHYYETRQAFWSTRLLGRSVAWCAIVIGLLGLVPEDVFGIGTVLDPGNLFESNGVVCGNLAGQWEPGVMKGSAFVSHLEKKKAFVKKAKRVQGSQALKLKQKAQRFNKLRKQSLATCAAGPGGDPAVFRGSQYYASSCALSGCHAGGDPSAYANFTSDQVLNAYTKIPEMSLLVPPKNSDLLDIVAYLGTL